MSRLATSIKLTVGAGGPASLSTLAADWLLASIPRMDGSLREHDEVVHNLRTAAKRARALVRLFGNVLGERSWRRENIRLRDTARALAGARDAAVAQSLLRKLQRQHRGRTADAITSALRSLASRPSTALSSADADAATAHARAVLLATATRLGQLRLSPAVAAAAIESALRASYRRSRRQMKHARSAGTAAAYHEWRKVTKRLCYQLQFPGLAESKRGRRLVRRLDELQERLGAEHDTQQTLALLRTNPAQLGGIAHAAWVTALLERRGRKLRARCVQLGTKVFAVKPEVFARATRRRLRPLRAEPGPA